MKTFISEGITTTLNNNLAKTSISSVWTSMVHRHYIVVTTLN